AVVPESCDEEFAVSLEKEAKKYLVSADIAYYLSDITELSVLFGSDYKTEMVKVENALNERKKLIINTGEFDDGLKIISIPESSDGMNDGISVKVERIPARREKICTSCGRRNGRYEGPKKADASDNEVCLSCLHKSLVGKNAKSDKYMRMYENYNGRKADRSVRTLEDIKDRDGHIAVVYGDGNNMGGIIQKFTDITQMMKFSRNVKDIAARAVFESMGENGIDRFEVVGLGGDDIFVIVPGNKAIKFSASLIRKYNEKFIDYKKTTGNVSTMSVGIAIAKYNTPVQVILEEAEKQLADAKSEVKKYPENKGSLSFRVLDNIDMSGEEEKSDISDTMLPYLTETAETIIKFAEKLKTKGAIGKTALRNLLDAFVNAESPLEANLFFEYYNARLIENRKNEKVLLPQLEKYTLEGGYYTRSKTDETTGNEKCFIWKDLLNIIDFLE
ncbi:MAG: hypothetical protein J5864_04990, partial [Oscillospiraceae bacterium]|nr:hypothetical protein [Oscillospiraceae bacterium]